MGARRVFVQSEWAPLRTVVLAASEFCPPDFESMEPAQLEPELSILPEADRAYLLSLSGRDLAEADPDRWCSSRSDGAGRPGPFLEGGDVLVLCQHVLVGSSGRVRRRVSLQHPTAVA